MESQFPLPLRMILKRERQILPVISQFFSFGMSRMCDESTVAYGLASCFCQFWR